MPNSVTMPSIATIPLSKEALDLTLAEWTWKALEWEVLQSQTHVWSYPHAPFFTPPQPIPNVPLP